MALHGVAFAIVIVGGVTFVSRHAPPATSATAQGILSAVVFSVSMIIGPGIGSWVADRFGVQAMFTMALTASLVATVVLWLATRPSGDEEPLAA